MDNDNTPVLTYGPRTFTRTQIIDLANEARDGSTRAIITQAFNFHLLEFKDFKEAKKTWVTEATLLLWRGDADTIALLPKVKKYIAVVESSSSAKPPVISKRVTLTQGGIRKKAVELINPLIYGEWQFEPNTKILQRGSHYITLSNQQAAVVFALVEAQGSSVSSQELKNVIRKHTKQAYTPTQWDERFKMLMFKMRHYIRSELGIKFNPIERSDAGYLLVEKE